MIPLPDIEKVSKEVHNAWVASKKSQDFHSRKSEVGEGLMIHYDQLSEKANTLL